MTKRPDEVTFGNQRRRSRLANRGDRHDDAYRSFIFHIAAALAELERSIIRERTRADLASARARGRKGGRPRPALQRGQIWTLIDTIGARCRLPLL